MTGAASSAAVATGAHGAYGLALRGLELPGWTVPADGWPEVDVEVVVTGVVEAPRRPGLHRHRGGFPLMGGGRAILEREPRRLTFRTPEPLPPDEVVHPHLSIAAAGLSYWLGRDPFHAGAVVGEGGAWMVAGRSGAGKSTTLAALAAAGAAVLSDDLVVVERGDVFAGPRAVDLRLDASTALGLDPASTGVRRAERRRLPLAVTAGRVPLVGWIDLEWGPSVGLRHLEATDRFRRLTRRRTFPAKLPAGTTVFDLAELPAWVLRRPRDFAALPSAIDAVLELIGGAGRSPASPTPVPTTAG